MNNSTAALGAQSVWNTIKNKWQRTAFWYSNLPEYLFAYVLTVVLAAFFYFGILSSLVNAYVYTFWGPARLGSLLAYSLLTLVLVIYSIKHLMFDEDWGEYEDTTSRRQTIFMSMQVALFITAIVAFITAIVCISRLLP